MAILIGTRLGPYEIRSALGAGGQGEVYRATDSALGRSVVIKVLAKEHALRSDLVARFEREARLASSLDHPNICTIHGLYKIEGVRFIAMQYVEGRNVRQLVNGHPLDFTSALAIAIQVAEALTAAHARGIIHRDIKASNVMVMDSGLVKVLDFGLAKLLDQDDEQTANEHLTTMGQPYGTATYAAPEQAKGQSTDHRADIFSTGVLLYEMLAGTWPFQGKSIVDVRYAVVHAAPKSLAEMRGESGPLIERLQAILDRALAKEPSARYQRVDELRDELLALLREIDPNTSLGSSFGQGLTRVAPRHRSGLPLLGGVSRKRSIVVASLAVSFLMAFVVYLLWNPSHHPAINSLAVLPFANLNNDPNTEYLSDGITESLINSLSQLPAIKVRSRNSVFQFKGRQTDLQKVGNELGVRAVLTGQVEHRGDSLLIAVELIDTRDDSHIWGEHYTRPFSALVALQEEISREITDKLRLRLSGAEERQLVKNYATNSDAYQLYLQGRYFWNKRGEDGLKKGISYFERAIEKDPYYAPAYSGLADCYSLLNVYDIDPATVSDLKAKDAATRALALDETLAEAHASLASVSYRFDWKWAESEQHFKRAIELKLDYATAHQWYSALLAAEGRFDEAIAEARRARDLEPFSLTINAVLGRRLYYARQFDQAIAVHRQSLELDRNFVRGHIELATVLVQVRRRDEARAEFQQALALDNNALSALSGLGYTYAVSGQKKQALDVVERLKDLGRQRYVSPYHLAVVYAGLGEQEAALDNLEQAATERYNWLVFLRVDPIFDGLRAEPRFVALVQRVGLSH